MASSSQEVTLIGVCDGWIDPRSYRTSYLTNKVGGHPDPLPVVSPPRPRCSRCGSPLALVVQIYCPLQASPYHRTLHVFACPGMQCGGSADSWTVFRSQCTEPEAARTSRKPLPAPRPPQRVSDWCEAADDWGDDQEEAPGGGGGETEGSGETEEEVVHADISSRFEDLLLEGPEDRPVFCPYFISVLEESDLEEDEDHALDHAQELLREYERREGVAVGELEVGDGEERYEKAGARHGDRVFSRFMKTISPCPHQILRYCRGGKPLFIAEPTPPHAEGAVPACVSCGGSRVFELQLMPALVSLLQTQQEGGAEGGAAADGQLDFGTVLVYTCGRSCWTGGGASAVEEFCFVQMDPDQKFFK